MTTYHHIPTLSSQQSLTGITVDTGTGATTVAQNVPVYNSFLPTWIGSANFEYSADGTNNVVMTVQGRSFSTVSGVLNGFELSAQDASAVPEPSSATRAHGVRRPGISAPPSSAEAQFGRTA